MFFFRMESLQAGNRWLFKYKSLKKETHKNETKAYENKWEKETRISIFIMSINVELNGFNSFQFMKLARSYILDVVSLGPKLTRGEITMHLFFFCRKFFALWFLWEVNTFVFWIFFERLCSAATLYGTGALSQLNHKSIHSRLESQIDWVWQKVICNEKPMIQLHGWVARYNQIKKFLLEN